MNWFLAVCAAVSTVGVLLLYSQLRQQREARKEENQQEKSQSTVRRPHPFAELTKEQQAAMLAKLRPLDEELREKWARPIVQLPTHIDLPRLCHKFTVYRGSEMIFSTVPAEDAAEQTCPPPPKETTESANAAASAAVAAAGEVVATELEKRLKQKEEETEAHDAAEMEALLAVRRILVFLSAAMDEQSSGCISSESVSDNCCSSSSSSNDDIDADCSSISVRSSENIGAECSSSSGEEIGAECSSSSSNTLEDAQMSPDARESCSSSSVSSCSSSRSTPAVPATSTAATSSEATSSLSRAAAEAEHAFDRVVGRGQTDLPRRLQRLLESRETLASTRLLRACNQAVLAAAVIQLKFSVGPQLPFKDKRGAWYLNIHLPSSSSASHKDQDQNQNQDNGNDTDKQNDCVVLEHIKGETCWDAAAPPEEQFEFTWRLRLEFDREITVLHTASLHVTEVCVPGLVVSGAESQLHSASSSSSRSTYAYVVSTLQAAGYLADDSPLLLK